MRQPRHNAWLTPILDPKPLTAHAADFWLTAAWPRVPDGTDAIYRNFALMSTDCVLFFRHRTQQHADGHSRIRTDFDSHGIRNDSHGILTATVTATGVENAIFQRFPT